MRAVRTAVGHREGISTERAHVALAEQRNTTRAATMPSQQFQLRTPRESGIGLKGIPNSGFGESARRPVDRLGAMIQILRRVAP